MAAEPTESFQRPRSLLVGYGHVVSDEDRAEWQNWANARAQQAYANGLEARAANDQKAALFWLNRAARMARDNPNVVFALMMTELSLGLWQEAGRHASWLMKRYELREAFGARIVAWLNIGQPQEAADILGQALSRFAPSAEISALAGMLMQSGMVSGWCAANNRGELSGAAREGVVLRLDGRIVARQVSLPFISPPQWHKASLLTVEAKGVPLLGSPIQLSRLRRCEGFARPDAEGVRGWLWYPADPDFVPTLCIEGDGTAFTVTVSDWAEEVSSDVPLARPRAFFLPWAFLPQGEIFLSDGYGQALTGSPVDPGLGDLLSGKKGRSLPLALRPRSIFQRSTAKPHIAPRPPGCLVVIPVYRDRQRTLACLREVIAHSGEEAEIVVIDDASPEPALSRALEKLAGQGRIRLLRHERNRGFPASANAGLALAAGRDAVLLNSDTLVPPGWLARLRQVLDRAPEIGTATPFSNDASILSYPSVMKPNAVPDRREMHRLDSLSAALPLSPLVDLPTANGFCMAIRGDCLQQIGLLREDIFAQGYGEENDFCLRATALGWRHVAATGVFVAHVGSVSFGSARKLLMQRNLDILNALYPGYDRLVAAFVQADPLFRTRRALDVMRVQVQRGKRRSVALITHNAGGGVGRVVRERRQIFEAQGYDVLVLEPDTLGCRIIGGKDDYPNLVFKLPEEWQELLSLLREMRVEAVEWHHLSGHAPQMRHLAEALSTPYDIFVHDYVWFCERISLVGPAERYCGEPSPAGCEACIAEAGSYLDEEISVPALLARSARELTNARQVMTPSRDAARRMARHFPGVAILPSPLEDDAALQRAIVPIVRKAWRRVCLVGALGREKGFDILLALAQDARARNLPLDYVLVGFTPEDDALLETGRVEVTGEYREDEVLDLIHASGADFGFIPSVCPETWCFTLGSIWQAGLKAVSFDLGAQGERIRESGAGWVVPLGLPIPALSDLLLRLY
ncbi:glycosyltransferase [Kozakia baliensis]|uniref:glycosyltransferase n=1 Tax=Kozakia baliensis TaxID=153496 RepID=UPI00068F5E1D|nr:glycosyltransferase [Kozakia baliensis]AOX20352.1 hypothetical protein A0U90_08640 [Kozakia baliensis]